MPGLVRIVKRKLKKIQYRPHLIDGCLAAAGLAIEPAELQLTRVCPIGGFGGDPEQLHCGIPLRSNCEGA
jgi:hypothetical protein